LNWFILIYLKANAMDKIKVAAPAKINLFLEVLGKRPDGYHDIHSWFQAVSLFDRIEIARNDSSDIRLRILKETILPVDRSNLVYKAAELMRTRYAGDTGFDIVLEKNIPVAAGLGGGSSDTASTLHGINRLLGLNLPDKELARLGLELGSDIPFFFSSGQAEVTGRGEIVKNIDLPLDYWIILVCPSLAVSTAESYAGLKMGLTSPRSGIKLFCCKDFKGLIKEISKINNDFERLHFLSFPELEKIRDVLLKNKAAMVRMSGSGPTIFGLYRFMPEGEGMLQSGRRDWRTFRVQPITLPAWE